MDVLSQSVRTVYMFDVKVMARRPSLAYEPSIWIVLKV